MNRTASSRHQNPLAELPIQTLLAGLAVVLLSWPIIQIAGGSGVFSWAIYLLMIWVGMILILAAIGRAISRQYPPPMTDQSPPQEHSEKGRAA